MTVQKMRELIELPTQMKGDTVFVIYPKDGDFRYDVLVTFNLSSETGRVQISGYCTDLKIPNTKTADALLFCNKFNKEKAFLSVYYDQDDRDLNAVASLLTEGTSDEAIKLYFKLIPSAIWNFFVAAGKEF